MRRSQRYEVVDTSLLAADMLGAYLFVHAGNGVFVTDNGYELVLVLGAASLLLAAVGAGRFGIDALVGGRRRGEDAPALSRS